jgi:hypothetical protein
MFLFIYFLGLSYFTRLFITLPIFGSLLYFSYFLTFSYDNVMKVLFINFNYTVIYDEISSASNRI